jgi:hypothetical protein
MIALARVYYKVLVSRSGMSRLSRTGSASSEPSPAKARSKRSSIELRSAGSSLLAACRT